MGSWGSSLLFVCWLVLIWAIWAVIALVLYQEVDRRFSFCVPSPDLVLEKAWIDQFAV
jgi:hypothetical protein